MPKMEMPDMKCFKTSLAEDDSHCKTLPLLMFAALSLLAGLAGCGSSPTPISPTLTFASIPTETDGNPPFAVSASSASSGTVKYSLTAGQTSSGTVTSAGMVTIYAAGTIYLTANQAASGSYAAASATTTVPIKVGFTASGSPILHVVVIMQENRTFDNLFNGFPGADSAQSGMDKGKEVPLSPIPLAGTGSLDNSHLGWWRDWDNGKMDGFAMTWTSDPLYPYSYVPSNQVQPYWTLATQYTLADRMFQSNTGPSFDAHLYMIAGQSGGADENPTGAVNGCDAPAGTTVAMIGPNGTDLPGVFPCFDFQTMADLLDAKGMTWRYYSLETGLILSPFEAIRHIFYAEDLRSNFISPQTQVLTDIANGQLAEVTWVTPDFTHSDHPGSNSNEGPDWVASIVNAIGASPFWNSTAIFINWDDWGGWYDHVVPPQIDNMGPGFRTPLIVVSPYAKRGYVSHQVYETASLITFMEKNFDLPNLGARDATANDLLDCFDYTQTATPFAAVKTKVTADMLMREKPSGPPDND
jgi:phospholipase C